MFLKFLLILSAIISSVPLVGCFQVGTLISSPLSIAIRAEFNETGIILQAAGISGTESISHMIGTSEVAYTDDEGFHVTSGYTLFAENIQTLNLNGDLNLNFAIGGQPKMSLYDSGLFLDSNYVLGVDQIYPASNPEIMMGSLLMQGSIFMNWNVITGGFIFDDMLFVSNSFSLMKFNLSTSAGSVATIKFQNTGNSEYIIPDIGDATDSFVMASQLSLVTMNQTLQVSGPWDSRNLTFEISRFQKKVTIKFPCINEMSTNADLIYIEGLNQAFWPSVDVMYPLLVISGTFSIGRVDILTDGTILIANGVNGEIFPDSTSTGIASTSIDYHI